MLNRLRTLGLISDEEADDADSHIPQIVEAMHAMLRKSPSLLIQAALVDGVGERRTQNQPGTSDQYPNWRIPLADEHGRVVHTDEVFDLPRVKSLAASWMLETDRFLSIAESRAVAAICVTTLLT